MQKTIQISTSSHEGLFDITGEVELIVNESGIVGPQEIIPFIDGKMGVFNMAE